MFDRLFSYKQQQHFKLLAQFVFRMSIFFLSSLPHCHINNSLIQFVCQDIRERSLLTSSIRPLQTFFFITQ